jgi:SpoVK/Ycf46/Vps4 family AAA+-type ATPase
MSKDKKKDFYKNNLEHIKEELSKLDLIIQLGVLNLRKSLSGETQEGFKGLFLSDQEIDSILEEKITSSKDMQLRDKNESRVECFLEAISKSQEEISKKKEQSISEGIYLALPQLVNLFNLSPFEEQCVLICLAPEIDSKYEKLYAYLQDDISRKSPSIELIVNLLCYTDEGKIRARALFLPQAPLLKNNVLNIDRNIQNQKSTLLSEFLKIDERIVNFLLGINSLNYEIESFSKLVFPKADQSERYLSKKIKNQLVEITKNHLNNSDLNRDKLIYYFYGPCGSGKRSLAEGICEQLSVPIIVADIETLLSRELPFENTIRLVFREALLQPAAIYINNLHRLLDEKEKYKYHLKILVNTIEEFSWLTFLAGENPWEPAGLFKENNFIKIDFPIPDHETRNRYWKSMANGKIEFSKDVEFDELATKFRFTPGQIKDALTAARNSVQLNDKSKSEIKMIDLYKGCRAQCNQKLGALAKKVDSKYTWDDIVLPKDVIWQLQAICDQVKFKDTVYEKWGFGQKLSLGKGLNALFSGHSGTGKTMAVEIIANELQLDLYKIDLASVVSKYIGETEKNLSKIFKEAENSNAILFFDEADALFGKRSEVKDAHDRYANIEVGYLLQKMEEYDGISILATNLKQNMDDAFLRRLHFLVDFPFPDEKYRYHIWEKVFPPDTPVNENIDFKFLSTHFKISGGNIKNIAVNSAFLAAADSGIVKMNHVMDATRQEYKKIGRHFIDSDLGKYADLLSFKEINDN